MIDTLKYYDTNADKFTMETQSVKFSKMQDRFLSLLPIKGRILDFGCGSGRDTKYFLEHGYQVDAIDGSEKMCQAASQYTGIVVKQILFQDFEADHQYDGIWACASLLHLDRASIQETFHRLKRALKEDGVLYCSFKYGDFEGERNGRYFTDLTESALAEILEAHQELEITENWITGDARAGRESEMWLNAILRPISNISN